MNGQMACGVRCAIYCRLSKEDGARGQESESIQNQKALLVEYANQQGWCIYDIYSDEDYSGADRARPALNEMLGKAQEGAFQVILCKTQSRFTRDLEMVEKYIHGLFPLWGIRFVALLDNADTEVRGNKKSRQINGLVNEWYLEDLSENIRAVLDGKRRAGKHIGSFAAYGYQKDPDDNNHLVIDPVAAQTVRRIFALYLGGSGTHEIAAFLNAQETPSPASYKRASGMHYRNGTLMHGGWTATAVSRVLKNELYIGNMVQGTKRKASYKSKRLLDVPREQWVRVEATHAAIVDAAQFEIVQQRLRQRTRSDGRGEKHLLAGRVRCMRCAGAMQRLTYCYKGERRSYLQCATYAKNRARGACSRDTVRLDRLAGAVAEEIRAQVARYYNPAAAKQSGERGTDRGNEKEIGLLQARQQKIAGVLKAAYVDKVGGLLTSVQFTEIVAGLEQEREELARREAALQRRVHTVDRNESLGEVAVEQALVQLLVDFVEVGEKDREKGVQPVRIHWKF